MRPLRYIPHYTVEDYQQWEGNWELIDGLPHAMSPSPVRKHQRTATKLVTEIEKSIQKKKEQCGDCEVVYELDWIVDESTILRPDLAIICNQKGDFITQPPVLIIEVLSPASAFKDRNVKFEIYREHNVKYYIIVDPTTKIYTVYQLIDKQYKEHNTLSVFVIHDKCEVQFNIEQALQEVGD